VKFVACLLSSAHDARRLRIQSAAFNLLAPAEADFVCGQSNLNVETVSNLKSGNLARFDLCL
jgi:hypothetical protein